MAAVSPAEIWRVLRRAGFSPEAATTFTAIALAESSGDPARVNPDGEHSVGLFQINMDAHGTTFGTEAQLKDPQTNANAAFALSNGGADISPWTVTHQDKGLRYAQFRAQAEEAARANGASSAMVAGAVWSGTPGYGTPVAASGGNTSGGFGSTSTTGGGSVALSSTATEQQILDFITEHYGVDIVGFLEIPELRKIIVGAAQGNVTSPDIITAQIRNSTWWKKNSESVREYHTRSILDPASLEATVKARESELRSQAEALGLNLGGPEGLRTWAENSLKYGWTADQLREKLAGNLLKQSNRSGFVESSIPDVTADHLMEIARKDYLTPISRADAERWAIRGLRQGEAGDVEAQFRDHMANIAMARFGLDLNSGITPADVMMPIRQTLAEQLELNPDAIDLLDPRYAEVLQTQGSDGGFRPMTTAEAMRWARSQDEYKYTMGAGDQAAKLGELISKTFGKVA